MDVLGDGGTCFGGECAVCGGERCFGMSPYSFIHSLLFVELEVFRTEYSYSYSLFDFDFFGGRVDKVEKNGQPDHEEHHGEGYLRTSRSRGCEEVVWYFEGFERVVFDGRVEGVSC